MIMEEYNLKIFTGVGARTGDYFISFVKSGFMLSSGFYQREGIKNYSRVFLYFDASKKAVGMQFVKEKDAKGTFAIIHSKNQATGSVSARSFVMVNKINKSEYFGRRTPKKIIQDGNEIFVIDLIKES